RLYRATLGREPDADGLANWTSKLTDGLTLFEVVAGFTNSPEFRARYGDTTTAEFVTLLYRNVFDRDPDPSGYAGWTGALERGQMTRSQVVTHFSQSQEFVNQTRGDVTAYMVSAGIDDHLDGGAGT